MHPLVNITTDISTNTWLTYWSIYWPKRNQYVGRYSNWYIGWHVDRHIDRLSVNILPGIAVNTGSIQWPLNVSGILVACRWYIDWLSYNTRCFRVFLKVFSVLEATSMELWQCWRPWKSCWKIDFPSPLLWSFRNEQFYWNEQTSGMQLSVTWSDIWVLFSRMFTYEWTVWRMGKFLNSCWLGVGVNTFWNTSWWGTRPSKLPTYPGIWQKFFKKVKRPAFCTGPEHGWF